MTAPTDDAFAAALAATQPLADLFAAQGHRLYLVGGVVREAVAGRFRDDADLDCTTDARPATVRRIVDAEATSLWAQGERFGTIGCVVAGRAFEITTHRAERYNEQSRKPEVVFGDDVLEDLERRDFTINAMALDTADATLLDPHGGRADLVARLLRTPLDPRVSFGEDPLRMLRAARFIADHDLAADPALLQAVTAMTGRIEIVAAERVRDELQKLLLLQDPTAGFVFLSRTGLMRCVLAEPAERDPLEVGSVVAAVPAEPVSRWASLFVEDSPSQAASRLRALRCSSALVAAVTGLLRARLRLLETSGAPSEVRRVVHECPVSADSALAFARAVAAVRGESGSGAALDRFAATLAELRASEDVDHQVLPLRGTDVIAELDLEAGPRVGQALQLLRDHMYVSGPLSAADARLLLRRWRAAGYGDGP